MNQDDATTDARKAPRRFSSLEELKTRHGIGFSAVWINQLVALGKFPAPYQLSPHRIAWDDDELDHWKASRPRAMPLSRSRPRAILPKSAKASKTGPRKKGGPTQKKGRVK